MQFGIDVAVTAGEVAGSEDMKEDVALVGLEGEGPLLELVGHDKRSLLLSQGVFGQQGIAEIGVAARLEELLEQLQALLAQDMGNDGDVHGLIERFELVQGQGRAAAHGILIGVNNGVDAADQKGGEAHQAGFHGGVDRDFAGPDAGMVVQEFP